MFDFLKTMFKKSEKPSDLQFTETNFTDEDVMAQMELSEHNAMDNGDDVAQDVAAEASMNSPVNALINMGATLSNSSKFGLFTSNSQAFENILFSLKSVKGKSSAQFSTNKYENMQHLKEMQLILQKLHEECEIYLDKGNSITASGKARKGLVATLKEMLATDIAGITNQMASLYELTEDEQSTFTWDEVFRSARVKKIQLTVEKGKLREYGGKASTLYRLDSSNATGGEGFFKVDQDVRASIGINVSSASKKAEFEATRDFVPISDELYNIAYKLDSRDTILKELESGELSSLDAEKKASLTAFAKKLFDVNYAHTTARGNIQNDADVENGASLELGERNVATSRIARLMGLGDLVVNSEMAELEYQENGETKFKKGLLMSAAEGGEAQDMMSSYDFSSSTDNAKQKLDKQFTIPLADVSFDVQRQMANLQVLDFVTGQIDRHYGNIMTRKDSKGQVDKITAIDSDFSFGRGNKNARKQAAFGGFVESEEDYDGAGGMIYAQNARFVVKEGHISMPYMDTELADRIMLIKEDMVEYCLIGLIKPHNIKACWLRIAALQRAIERDKKEHPDKFLAQNQWNEDTHNTYMQHTLSDLHGIFAVDLSNTSMYGAFMLGAAGLRNPEKLVGSDPEAQKKLQEAIKAARAKKAT